VPTYLAAYTYVEFLDFTGPVQQVVRVVTGAHTLRDYWFPQIRSFGGGVFVLSMVLFPYSYVACRSFFLMQSGSINAAARTLGATGLGAFFRITIPLVRPALVVGATLAMLEVVNDLGAVQYFGINSLTAVIYATWINRSNFAGAAQLATVVVLVIGALILLERWLSARHGYAPGRAAPPPPPRTRLGRVAGIAASLFCTGLVVLGFGIPAGQLLSLASRAMRPETVALAINAGISTLVLGALGATAVTAVGVYAAKLGGSHASPADRVAVRLSAMGYAVPGTVLALGLLQPLAFADLWINRATIAAFDWRPGLILSGSIAALIYVYCIRFLAVSHATIDAGLRKRGDSVLLAGRVLGAARWRLLFRVDLPTLSPAMFGAATLVFVEIVKELPATLLLRPLGVETLATAVYARANVGLMSEAALPAIAIVLVGLFPVLIGAYFSDARR
jgi:iron(III) transport system permease protein